MRFPIPLLVGTSFEGLARVLHFLVELTKHHLSNGHDFLPCGIRELRHTDTRRTKSELSSSFFTTSTPRLQASRLCPALLRERGNCHTEFASPEGDFTDGLDSPR